MKPDPTRDFDALSALLEEWQPRPEPSTGFDMALRRKILAAQPAPRWGWRLWAAPAVAAALLATIGLFLFTGGNNNPVASHPVAVVRVDPVVRDLQTMNQDAELLENLDFLSEPNRN
jgi:hypothetical protein